MIAITVSISTFPTGKKAHKRSPSTYVDGFAWYIDLFGDVHYDYFSTKGSYGKSPDTDWYGDTYLVYLSGSVSSGGNDGIGGVQASYGINKI